MKKIILSTLAISSLVLAGGHVSPPKVEKILVEQTVETEEASSWSFEFSPYLAMSSISGDSGVVTPSAPMELDFDTILDALEFGSATHLEAYHNSGWGFGVDYNYISLGADGDANILRIDVKQAVFEGYAIYRQQLSNGTLDYFAGVRNWRLKMDARIQNRANLRNTDESWIDGIVGAKWTNKLSENWNFYVRGDIGAGNSDLTASASVGFRYSINEWLDLDMNYKGLWVDYETGTPNTLNYFKYDTVTSGPIIGLNFKF